MPLLEHSRERIDFTRALLPQRNPPTRSTFSMRHPYTNAENADYLNKLKIAIHEFMGAVARHLVDNTLNKELPITYIPPYNNVPEDFKINLTSKYDICSKLFYTSNEINYILQDFVYNSKYWYNKSTREQLYSYNDVTNLECYKITGPRTMNIRYSHPYNREQAEKSTFDFSGQLRVGMGPLSDRKFLYFGELDISLIKNSEFVLYQLIAAYFKQQYPHLLTPENLQKIKEGYSQKSSTNLAVPNNNSQQQQRLCSIYIQLKEEEIDKYKRQVITFKRKRDELRQLRQELIESKQIVQQKIKDFQDKYDNQCASTSGGHRRHRQRKTLRRRSRHRK